MPFIGVFMINDISQFDIFEGMTSISAVINSIKNGSNDRMISKIYFDSSKSAKKSRELGFLKHASSLLNFELCPCDSEFIDSLVSGNTHGGIVMLTSKRTFPTANVNFLTNGNFYALIEGLEDPYNFGYSVRSLYAAGIDGIILPERNWMELSGVVARASAGTSELANIAVGDVFEAAQLFKDNGFEIVCAGIRDSVSLYEYEFAKPTLLIIGGEKRGISRKLLELSDVNVKIPYGRDFIGSLPSASATSVMAFEIAKKKGNLQ
jgi:23S rRNA (guanosine2251-2'-O)-methyltransferase